MKANARIRDLSRRSLRRLTVICRDGISRGTTTYPLTAKSPRYFGKQTRIPGLRIEWR